MAKELTHKEVFEKALANPDVKREYDALEPEFELRRALIVQRLSTIGNMPPKRFRKSF